MAEKRTILNRPTISAPFLSSNLTFVLENKPILILGPLICPGETILKFRCYKKVSPNAKLEHNTCLCDLKVKFLINKITRANKRINYSCIHIYMHTIHVLEIKYNTEV